MKINKVVIKPVLTEKATQFAASNTYTFQVDRNSNKNQVAHFLEKLYKVKVADVRIVSRIGKVKRVGRKMQNKKLSNIKIAYVTLSEGKIDIFPQA